jgi:hypothetical protein
MGDAGAKYEPSHRQLPPHVRAARGTEGGPGRGHLTFALHGVHEVPLVQLAAQLLLQAEATDANDLLHVRQVFVLVVSLAVNRALQGPNQRARDIIEGTGGRLSPWAQHEQVQEPCAPCTPSL